MNKLLTLLLFCLPQLAAAEQPLVQFPTGSGAWAVTFEQKATPPPEAPQPGATPKQDKDPTIKRIEVAQVTDARRTIIYWTSGKSREMWSLPKMNLMLTQDPAGNVFTTRNVLAFGDPFSPDNFEWINHGAQPVEKGPVQYGGVECNHYKGGIQVQVSGSGERTIYKTVPCEAWIDAKTLLPVAFRRDTVLGKFTFGPPPESLVMPEKFKKDLDYYKMTQGG